MIRRVALVLLSATLLACPSKDPAKSSGGASAATIAWNDAGTAELDAFGVRVALPAGDLPAPPKAGTIKVVEDDAKRRLAVPIANGEARLVYKIGDGWFVGGTTKVPVDMRSAPALEEAYGAIFEKASKETSQRVFAEAKKGGDDAMVKLLLGAADVDVPGWDEAYAALPEPSKEQVKKALARALDADAPTRGLRRAVTILPLKTPDGKPVRNFGARARDLTSREVREPRAVAVLLRVMAADTTQHAADAGFACVLLDRVKKASLADAQGKEALVDAAGFYVANVGLHGLTPPCSHLESLLGEELCQPFFRCGPNGPLAGNETTLQDEPLCTKEQLVKAFAQELDRSPKDVMALTGGARPAYYAFASMVAGDRLPKPFVEAHARRAFTITQPKEPSCESGGLVPGTPCHADEASLRYFACAHEPGTVQVGLVRFKVDEKTKKISEVSASLPP